MEEHIGKRVNHERVEEALDTGASKIATGCPFCRVMMTDGVDDVAAANDIPKAEVLDVAQLLLGSLDKSSVTLPEKGAAAKEAEERAAKAETAPNGARPRRRRRRPRPEPKAEAAARCNRRTKPVTGLGIAGGAKRPGAKKRRPGGAGRKARRRSAACQGAGYRRGRQASGCQEGRAACRRSTAPNRPRPNPSRDSASPQAHDAQEPRRQRRQRLPPNPRRRRPEPGIDGERAGSDREPSHRSRASASPRVPGGPARRRRSTRHQPAAATAGTSSRRRTRIPAPSLQASEGNGESRSTAGEGAGHRQGCTPAGQALTGRLSKIAGRQ